MINSLIILAATNNTISTPWWVYLLYALAGGVVMKLAKRNRAERNRRDEYDAEDDKPTIMNDKMKTFYEIKQMMSAGETAEAEGALKELLASEPENLEAKMLYGTCRQLLGDEETFKRIHDEIMMKLENEDETELQPGTVSLWKKYHRTFLELTGPGLAKEADREEIRTLYGCFDYEEETRPMEVNGAGDMEEIINLKIVLNRRRRRKRIVVFLLLIATPFLIWLACWLGQKL